MNAHTDGSALREATRLLRERHYAQASDWLDKAIADGECTLPQALDLRARSNAQQGFGLEAERLWREALALEPENPDYQAGLETLRRRYQTSPWIPVTLVTALAGVGLCLYLLFAAWPQMVNTVQMTGDQQSEALANQAQAWQRQVALTHEALSNQSAALDSALERHTEALSARWVQAQSEHKELADAHALHIAKVVAQLQASIQGRQAAVQQTRDDYAALKLALAQSEERLTRQNEAHALALDRAAAVRNAALREDLHGRMQAAVDDAIQAYARQISAQAQAAGAHMVATLTETVRNANAQSQTDGHAQLESLSRATEALRIQLDTIAAMLASAHHP